MTYFFKKNKKEMFILALFLWAEYERVFNENLFGRSAENLIFCVIGIAWAIFLKKRIVDDRLRMYAGTYGTQQNAVKKRIQKLQNEDGAFTRKTKWKYYLSRLFPSMEFYETYYSTIYKHKILIPFYIIYRLFRGVFRSGKRLFKEAMIVWKMDK